MILNFITGNNSKYEEVANYLGKDNVALVSMELEEIQEIDPKKIIEHKLKQAQTLHKGPFIVEDVSFELDALEGLPGPLVKWIEKGLGLQGMYEFIAGLKSQRAQHRVTYGYLDTKGNISFFEGLTKGIVVPLKGDSDFGWGPMFKPDGANKTYGEMSWDEKQDFSPRVKALKNLKTTLFTQ